jgi:hypothetical protein
MSQAPQMGIPPIQGIYDDSQEIHEKVNEELKEEAAGTGATLHTFHPDAAPETKRQEALDKAGVEMPNIRNMIPGKETPPTLTTDIGSSDNQAVADALTNTDTVAETPTRLVSNTDTKEGPTTPGAFKSGPAKGLPDWYKVGWTGFSDLPNPGDEIIMSEFSKVHTSEEIQELYKGSRGSNGEYNRDVLAQFVNEKYYGEWWFNVGAVFISIFFTWLLIKCGLGLMSCFVVGAFFGEFFFFFFFFLERSNFLFLKKSNLLPYLHKTYTP